MSLLGELKEIDIVSFLTSNGHKIEKESESKVWFRSPLRSDSDPSFVVFKNTNNWKDFGSGLPRGDIIDLVQAIDNCGRVEAMDKLKNSSFATKFEPIEVSKDPLLTVVKVVDKYIDPRLMMYMQSRRIPKNIYERYTVECHYSFRDTPDKIYTGVGFCNDSNGWELRSKVHKYATAPKDITTLNDDGGTLNLFEGFINYFSALVYFGVEQLEGTTIVMNGLGMIYRILPTVGKYQKINCFLDHGTGGDNITDLIKSRAGADVVYDQRYLYPIGMDFNDLICSTNL